MLSAVPSVGHWLVFEVSDADDGVLTLEAMASVAPGQLAQVWAEVGLVLSHMARLACGAAAPLDQGGEWDMLLQLQCDGTPPKTLHWPAAGASNTPPCVGAGVQWATVTLTLVARPSLAEAMVALFQPD